MKKSAVVFFSFFFVCSIVLFIGSSSKATGTLQAVYAPQEYVPHELLVKLKEDTVGDILQSKRLIRNVFDQVQGKIKTYLNEEKDTFDWDPSVFENRSFHADPYLFRIRVPEGIDLDYAIWRLKSNPYVEYVERNAIVRLTTEDPYFDQQWGLLNTVYSGRDIHAEEAWTISTGNSEVIVAVLDTGLDYDHEDILGNLWQNPNEIPNDNQDNDRNGFTDDLRGWNFSSGGPGDPDPMDDQTHQQDYYSGECVPSFSYHGTHTSGIIGAEANNEKGISGVCWNVKIMPLKIFDWCGRSSNDRIINAIDYATNNGAFLTSNSYGNFPYSAAVKAAITRAQDRNRLYVVSAGNAGINIDANPRYPVCYPNENIIGVLATKRDDTRWGSSNYGQNSVDIGAPGHEIMSLKRGDTVQEMSGTSMAAPFVAGVAALTLGVCPGLTYGRLKDFIIDGADYVANLNNKCVADGRLNVYNVLNALGGATSPSAPSNLIAYPINWYTIGLQWNDNSNNELGFEIQRRNQYQTAFLHDNCADMSSTSTANCQETIDNSVLRTYNYRVRAVNRAGISSFSNTYEFTMPQTVPDAPTDLNGQSPTLEQNVNIYWTNHAANALYNYVERRIPGETDWEVITTLGYNVDSYSDNDAQAGHTYQYRVKAGNPIGYSSYSNTISIEVIEW